MLLLLRAGVIALLALALARPSMKLAGAIGNQEAPVAAALVFDAAPHMEYRHENQTRLEAARRFGALAVDPAARAKRSGRARHAARLVGRVSSRSRRGPRTDRAA